MEGTKKEYLLIGFDCGMGRGSEKKVARFMKSIKDLLTEYNPYVGDMSIDVSGHPDEDCGLESQKGEDGEEFILYEGSFDYVHISHIV